MKHRLSGQPNAGRQALKCMTVTANKQIRLVVETEDLPWLMIRTARICWTAVGLWEPLMATLREVAWEEKVLSANPLALQRNCL